MKHNLKSSYLNLSYFLGTRKFFVPSNDKYSTTLNLVFKIIKYEYQTFNYVYLLRHHIYVFTTKCYCYIK